ncbi:MAG: OB-fold nucleic acid binding domain-containing protein [Nanoarchaeota archaeon]|nr:OB-fold nucleic acid binding domain-containing protein [Nanoarchaeota archaeon]
MPEGFNRRLPAIPRLISEISSDDIRVRIMGTVLDVSGNRLVLDDGTGKVTVTFEELPAVAPHQLVRIFGRVIPLDGGVELSGELLQDMTGLDLALHRSLTQA